MKKEQCFGIIPLTYRENYYEVFLVQHMKGNYWGFPKGHPISGESPKETAERELKEETSMSVIRYLPHPYLSHSYTFMLKDQLIEKSVWYYLAEVTPQYQITSIEEIIQGKWIALGDLLSYITFKDEQTLFQKLIHLLK